MDGALASVENFAGPDLASLASSVPELQPPATTRNENLPADAVEDSLVSRGDATTE